MAQLTEAQKAVWFTEYQAHKAEYTVDDSNIIFVSGNQVNVEARRFTRTIEQAEAFKAQFPKSYNVKAGRLSYGPGQECGTNALYLDLMPTKGNDKNESGIKRLKAFLKKAEALGYEVRWSKADTNNTTDLHSMEEVENFVSPWIAARARVATK